MYGLVQQKGTVLLSTSLAWPAVAGCSRAESFSQLSANSFAQPCTRLAKTINIVLGYDQQGISNFAPHFNFGKCSTELKGEDKVAWTRALAPSGRRGEFTQPSLHLLAEYCISLREFDSQIKIWMNFSWWPGFWESHMVMSTTMGYPRLKENACTTTTLTAWDRGSLAML